ncbi:MAG TPA: ribonuclease HII [Candidatus Nanoarchaeia archaeon]|nr:ribonuclease HII [Candidatus Nanoarchaeia archaeon]
MTSRYLNDKLIEAIRADGYDLVAGVDEVGRGCLAGPVTAAAVILPRGIRIAGARDSKLVPVKNRQELAGQIKRRALGVGVGWATSAEVDRYGLTWAVATSAKRALSQLERFHAVLLDGKHNYLKDHCHSRVEIKADDRCLSVACASIVAKVARDRYMNLQHKLHPQYGWDSNVGYGTRAHIKAMQQGLSPLHRRRFMPVASMELALVSPSRQDAFFERLFDVD